MSGSLYPAPRWFREVVLAWLDEREGEDSHVGSIDKLFTRITEKQPPDLRVVVNNELTQREEP